MSGTVTLDVETVGLLGGARDYPDPRRLVALDQAEDETPEAMSKFLALSPALARVVCVGLWHHEQKRGWVGVDAELFPAPGAVEDAVTAPWAGEAFLLGGLAQKLTETRPDRLVTFNGAGFDLPLLINRMVAHGIKPPDLFVRALTQKPWESGVHTDIRLRFGWGKAGRGTLREYAVGMLGVDPKAEGDGSHVADLLAKRDGTALARYCLGDCRTTAALFERWRSFGLPI